MIKHKPCDMSLIEKEYPECTICQVLRTIYRRTTYPETQLMVRTAVSMAKAMSSRLTFYHEQWEIGFWDKNATQERNGHERYS
jgi:hypothetical protein